MFDLELVKRFKKGQLSEIVEIGACKIDPNKKQIIDQFQIYIKPRSGYVSKSTRKFIKMKKEDIQNAVSFQEGIELFKTWLGESYYLCSWGKDDKAHIMNQCVRSKINLDWFQNYNDIQKPISKLLTDNQNNQLGLKNALQLATFDHLGVAHRGIDDALNTAQLLLRFIDKLELSINALTKKELSRSYKDFLKSLAELRAQKSQN